MRVRWTRLALDDLSQAHEFLLSERLEAAADLLSAVDRAVKKLRKLPRMGRVVPERRAQGYREIILPPYRLVYAVSGGEIQILRLWHSRRDPAGI